MEDSLVETWQIHDRIHRYLLTEIAEESLTAALAPKHRTVGGLFAHIHNVRLMWLKSAAPELLEGLAKLEAAGLTKPAIESALEASGTAVAELLRRSVAAGGKVKGFKPHVVGFLGYLISHESHHRGQVLWNLKNTGHPVSQKVGFGLWEWGVR